MKRIGEITAFYSKHDLFSNHYWCDILIRDITFNSGEQFMMYTKAMYFKDFKSAEKIMAADNCQFQKILGRAVKPYDDLKWSRVRKHYVSLALWAKANQHPDIRQALFNTEDSIIVEASPTDRVWGVGIGIEDPRIWDPKEWQGQNLLGRCWMEIRTKLLGKAPALLES